MGQYLQAFMDYPIQFLSLLIIFILLLIFTDALKLWFKNLIHLFSTNTIESESNKREAFKKLLDEHSERFIGFTDHRNISTQTKDFADMRKNMLLWGSDAVLYEYALFVEKSYPQNEVQESEFHFAKAILAYRKEIGYKNKGNKISPEQIVFIYKILLRGNII